MMMKGLVVALMSVLTFGLMAQENTPCEGFVYDLTGYEFLDQSDADGSSFVSKYYFKDSGANLQWYELEWREGELAKVLLYDFPKKELKGLLTEEKVNVQTFADEFDNVNFSISTEDGSNAVYSVHFCGSDYEPVFNAPLYSLDMRFTHLDKWEKFMALVTK